MTFPRLFAAIAVVLAALVTGACGDDDGPSGGKVPTATLPAKLPDPLILEGTPTLPTAAPSGATYEVQSGDSLYSIAERLGVDPDEIIRLNNLADPTQLSVGQILRVPGVEQSTPSPGRTPAAGTPTPRPGNTATPRAAVTPGEGETTYTVQSGDSAADIAARYGITVEELAAANNTTVEDLRTLDVGDVLVIPATAATPAPTEEADPTAEPPAENPTPEV